MISVTSTRIAFLPLRLIKPSDRIGVQLNFIQTNQPARVKL